MLRFQSQRARREREAIRRANFLSLIRLATLLHNAGVQPGMDILREVASIVRVPLSNDEVEFLLSFGIDGPPQVTKG